MNLGVEPAARDAVGLRAVGLARACRGLMRPAARRVHHHLFHVGLLHTLKKVLEMTFTAPICIALVDHTPFSQLIWQVAPSGTRAGHPEQGIEKRPSLACGAALAG